MFCTVLCTAGLHVGRVLTGSAENMCAKCTPTDSRNLHQLAPAFFAYAIWTCGIRKGRGKTQYN